MCFQNKTTVFWTISLDQKRYLIIIVLAPGEAQSAQPATKWQLWLNRPASEARRSFLLTEGHKTFRAEGADLRCPAWTSNPI
jgi:hypothetical protein